MSGTWKMDCHVHTLYSHDCKTSLGQIIGACEKKKLDAIAVTDHNSICGAIELKRIAPFMVVIGEEISTKQGEIIGYFLTEEIPPGLEAKESMTLIKEQGGLVCVPHPFDRMRKSVLERDFLQKHIDLIDIIEVFNSRNLFLKDNSRALSLAEAHKKRKTVGSDAHSIFEIGSSHVECRPFYNASSFLASIQRGVFCCKRSSFLVHFYTKWYKFMNKLKE